MEFRYIYKCRQCNQTHEPEAQGFSDESKAIQELIRRENKEKNTSIHSCGPHCFGISDLVGICQS